ncbi:MAG TPA: HAMP domain-containing sensor histidine kinase [Chthoniobacterales bacterium]
MAIFLPSLGLGWLALRTAGEQRVLLERQEAGLRQAETDAISARIREQMDQMQQRFAETVRSLARVRGAAALAEDFATKISGVWPEGGVPFAISPDGSLAFPSAAQSRQDANFRDFVSNSGAFLSNQISERVFQTQSALPLPDKSTEKTRAKAESKEAPFLSSFSVKRNVAPQRHAESQRQEAPASKSAPAVSDFQSATEGVTQGTLARFVQNELEVLFWTRPDPGANWIFGVMLNAAQLAPLLQARLAGERDGSAQLAVLDERARPVARQPREFTADWKRPFVATEIGEALPQWEVALYLADPGKLTESARLVTTTLILLIALALAAILTGGFFVTRDARQQLALAQKKTDFVSNVSHELKTPLTSIRLFAEMLAEGRAEDPEKRNRYLRILMSESERLTRLVNNVLDFARSEKGRRNYQRRAVDLRALIAGVWEGEQERLREKGFSAEWQAEPGDYSAHCDPDAISQVLVNLLSNAEKYSNGEKEIGLGTGVRAGVLEIRVRDRGIGIPRGLDQKIFEPFFRADDSLASGAQGSGLGLTLARRIARDHGGNLVARAREGGGSVFIFTLPLT